LEWRAERERRTGGGEETDERGPPRVDRDSRSRSRLVDQAAQDPARPDLDPEIQRTALVRDGQGLAEADRRGDLATQEVLERGSTARPQRASADRRDHDP